MIIQNYIYLLVLWWVVKTIRAMYGIKINHVHIYKFSSIVFTCEEYNVVAVGNFEVVTADKFNVTEICTIGKNAKN